MHHKVCIELKYSFYRCIWASVSQYHKNISWKEQSPRFSSVLPYVLYRGGGGGGWWYLNSTTTPACHHLSSHFDTPELSPGVCMASGVLLGGWRELSQASTMGALTSRQSGGVEEVDIGVNHAYRYPPKSGQWCQGQITSGISYNGCPVVFGQGKGRKKK